MCQVNNERERNFLGEEKDQIGREPIRWRRRRKEKKKRKKTKMEKKKMRQWGEKQCVGKKKGKWEREKEKIFLVFRQSEINSLRTKVGPCQEGYAWVLKFEFFFEVPKGRGFLLHRFLFI